MLVSLQPCDWRGRRQRLTPYQYQFKSLNDDLSEDRVGSRPPTELGQPAERGSKTECGQNPPSPYCRQTSAALSRTDADLGRTSGHVCPDAKR